MRDCGIALETLADYCAGIAAREDTEVVDEHLRRGCPHCDGNTRWLRALVGAIRETKNLVQPTFTLDRARAVFRERMQSAYRPPLVARLTFDGLSRPALAGVRNAGPTAYQRVYSSANFDIDLWHEPMPGGSWYVMGQALPRNDQEPAVPDVATMSAAGQAPVRASLDGSEFHFAGLPSGVYTLDVALPTGHILVENLAVAS